MRLKSFYAKTMTEAMQMVRETLGEDAIIVATREEKGGKAVRVTAAVEPAFELVRGGAASSEDWLQYDSEEDQNAIAEELTDVMLKHAVPEEIMDQVISCATVIGLEQPGIALIAAIEHLFNFRPLPQKPAQKALMMVGPPGSGKTLAAAKIATRGVMAGLKVGLISCDTQRAGGLEQLQAFTRILRVDLKKASTAKDLHAIMGGMDDMDHVIIDTASLNPFDKEEIKTIARLIGAADIEPYLVLAAAGDAQESGEIARIFGAVGVHHLLPTRLDMARRLGGVLAAAHQGGLSFADVSHSAKVAEGLGPLTPQGLAQYLMPAAFSPARADPSSHALKRSRQ